jgi:hypothetical protein
MKWYKAGVQRMGFQVEDIVSSGEWARRRRQTLDFTRVDLANQMGCSPEKIKKVERDGYGGVYGELYRRYQIPSYLEPPPDKHEDAMPSISSNDIIPRSTGDPLPCWPKTSETVTKRQIDIAMTKNEAGRDYHHIQPQY